MSNPNISFRLTKYQLARGLWLIRKLAPDYKPTSIAQLVKLIYMDYLAKMNYGRSNIVPQEILDEITIMTSKPRSTQSSLKDIIKDKTSNALCKPVRLEQNNPILLTAEIEADIESSGLFNLPKPKKHVPEPKPEPAIEEPKPKPEEPVLDEPIPEEDKDYLESESVITTVTDFSPPLEWLLKD